MWYQDHPEAGGGRVTDNERLWAWRARASETKKQIMITEMITERIVMGRSAWLMGESHSDGEG